MLGTNLTGRIDEIVTGAFVTKIASFRYRIQPVKYHSQTGYLTKANHITFKFFANTINVIPGNKLVNGLLEYIVVGIGTYTDTLGKHQEVVVRQINSHMHQSVTLKTLSGTQTNFDPILKEWVGDDKTYTTKTINVLIDPKESSKESFISVIDAGKLEEIDWIMTVDLPEVITKNQKVMLYNEEYLIKWIVPQPFQTLVGLIKSKTNYTT